MKKLTIKGTKEDVNKILERLAKENKELTIREFLDKFEGNVVLC